MSPSSGVALSGAPAPEMTKLGKSDSEAAGPAACALGSTIPTNSTQYSIDDAMDAIGFGRLQVLLVLYTGMAWFADALEMILLSFVGPAARCSFMLTPSQEGFISSVVFAGVLAGSYLWGFVADSYGRRVGFMAPAICTLLFGVLSALSPSYGLLLLSRMMVGFGIGGASVVFSLCSEFLPSSSRGFWLVFIEFFWTVGTLFEASMAWLVMPSLHWRVLVLLSAFPFAVLLLAYPLLPESPRFLLANGDVEGAQRILGLAAKCNGRLLPPGRLAPLQRCAQASQVGTAAPAARSAEASVDEEVLQLSGHEAELASRARVGEGEEEAPLLSSPTSSSRVPDVPGFHNAAAASAGGRGPALSALDAVRGKLKQLLSPPLLASTLVLWLVFFASAFTYYGLVLLTTQLPVSDADPSQSQPCGADLTSGHAAVGTPPPAALAPGHEGSSPGRMDRQRGLAEWSGPQPAPPGPAGQSHHSGVQGRMAVADSATRNPAAGPCRAEARLSTRQLTNGALGLGGAHSAEGAALAAAAAWGQGDQREAHRPAHRPTLLTDPPQELQRLRMGQAEVSPFQHTTRADVAAAALPAWGSGLGQPARVSIRFPGVPLTRNAGHAPSRVARTLRIGEGHGSLGLTGQAGHIAHQALVQEQSLNMQHRSLEEPLLADGCAADGTPIISNAMYRDVLFTSCSELPGLVVALLLVDRLGRKLVLWLLLLAAGLLLLPLLFVLPEAPTALLLFASRASIMGSFSVLWAYTPEVYPTSVRSTGLSIANAWGRLGGFLCPFVAVTLVESCQRVVAIVLFVAVPVVAALITAWFAQETKGNALVEDAP